MPVSNFGHCLWSGAHPPPPTPTHSHARTHTGIRETDRRRSVLGDFEQVYSYRLRPAPVPPPAPPSARTSQSSLISLITAFLFSLYPPSFSLLNSPFLVYHQSLPDPTCPTPDTNKDISCTVKQREQASAHGRWGLHKITRPSPLDDTHAILRTPAQGVMQDRTAMQGFTQDGRQI